MTEITDVISRPVRRDVTRNRQRLLAAAEEVVAERGASTTLDEVARRAGLGVGTAYRHFARKSDLISAMFVERLRSVQRLAAEVEREEDAGAALARFLREVGRMQAADRGLREALFEDYRSEAVTQIHDELWESTARLVARAQAAGQIHPDSGPGDVALIMMTLGAICDTTGEVAPELWERCLDLILDGLAADDAPRRRPALPSPSKETMARIVERGPVTARPSNP